LYQQSLNDRSLVRISGKDATDFLENLITCNVVGMKENVAQFGALLNPQGKILFDFFLLNDTNGYRIDIASELAEEFVKRLTFYRLRADVALELEENATVTACWNDYHKSTQGMYRDSRHAKLGFRLYGENNADFEAADYATHCIKIGMPDGGKDYDYGDAYPHETLMDQFGGVDFKKGCYVGQEVVSRMQHRGSAKKRIVQVHSEAGLPVTGTEIKADGKPAGRLGSVVGEKGLALLRLDRVHGADKTLAGDVAITAQIPDWVSFGWPEARS